MRKKRDMKQRKKPTAPLKTSLVPEKRLSKQHPLTDPVRPFDVNEPEVPVATSPARTVLHTPGRPLDEETRAFMEPRFGYDFSKVRIHADGGAATSAVLSMPRPTPLGKTLLLIAGSTHLRWIQENASSPMSLLTLFNKAAEELSPHHHYLLTW